ncbi:MAG: DHA2 family efflux MFS transporter permease subunit [Alphaproteobacteria bacterium]|nr:DHA2 family efflux MFS transporter permease subunit [Alphaproteobacteria bacterium]
MTSQAVSASASGYGRTHGLLIVVMSLMSSMALALSGTIVNVAVPDIMGAFGVGQDLAQWMATAFFAAMTTGLLASSWAIRSFGQRQVFVGMMGVFIAGSVVGGTSQEFNIIILARTIQGFAAGVILPLTQLAMYRVFGPDRRATANGWFGLSFVLGPGIGPWVGGLAIDAFDWRFTFYVALPIAATTALLGSFVLPSREETGPRPNFDIFGFALLAVALMASLSGLSNGQRLGWASDTVVLSLTLGIFSAVAFVLWEWWHDDPLLDVRQFGSRHFAAANVLSFLFGVGLFGSLYLTPIYVQLVQSYTPTRAGLVLIPAGLILGLVMPLMGRIGDRVPAYIPIILGSAGFAWSNYALGNVDANTAFWTFALIVMIGRAAHSAIFPPLMAAGLRNIPAAQIPSANGTINFTRQLGGAFGINLLAIFLEQRIAFFSDAFAATQSASNAVTAEFLDKVENLLAIGGLPETIQQPGALLYLSRVVSAQATTMAFRETFLMFAIVGLSGMVFALFLRSPKTRG